MKLQTFTDSPPPGRKCICSYCLKPIRTPVPIRAVSIRACHLDQGYELRFHDGCFEKAREEGLISLK